MNTMTTKSQIPSHLMAELQEAADNAAKSDVDLADAAKVFAEIDMIREEIRAKHGILDIGVPAIREIRSA